MQGCSANIQPGEAVYWLHSAQQETSNMLLGGVAEREHRWLICGICAPVQNTHLREEVQRLLQRIRVMEDEVSRNQRYAAEET